MSQTRREFLWTASAAAAALALQRGQGVFWSSQDLAGPGWEPGLESRLNSTCLLCPARCGIRGRAVDGRLVGVFGNPLHPMSQGGVCPRGIAGVQVLYHPERVTSPLLHTGPRGGGDWQPISRDEAVRLLADRLVALRGAGRPDRLAVVSGYCEGTMRDLWQQFLQAFGSPNYVPDDYPDATDTVMSLMHGIGRRPGYDLDHSGLVLSFGAPLFEAWWSPLQAFVAFGGSGRDPETARARFVQVDTRFSRTAARAHEWLGIHPGTYAALALGIAYVLIKEELYDTSFVTQHVSGFEDTRDAAGVLHEGYRSIVLRHYRSEEVSAITGVPVERIVPLARTFATRRPAVAVCGPEVTLAPDGLLAAMAVHSLNILVGSVNRRGGVVFGSGPPLAPLAIPVLDAPARIGLAREPVVAAGPMGHGDAARRFAEAVAGARADAPDVLLLYYANPLASSTQPDAWQTALSQVPLVVSFSPFLDETARHADLIIPDLLPYERWQDGPAPASYPYEVWSVAQPLVEPPPGASHTGDVLLAVARALGGSVARSLPYQSVEEVLQVRARGLFGARRGMTFGEQFDRTHYRQMEERGWWLPQHTDFDAFWSDLVERGGWSDFFYDETDPDLLARTPDGRIQLLPDRLSGYLAATGRRPYDFSAAGQVDAPGEFPLRLMPYRSSTLASGTVSLEPWLAEQPTLFPEHHWIPWVEVNPQTAAALGLPDGTMVWVTSARGRYRARLKIFPGTAPGNVGAPYGPRHPDGELANPLQLLDGSSDPLTGLSCWYTTFVRLDRA